MLPLLPLYATELGAPPFVLGLLTSSFAITNAIGQLGTGFLSERFGARRTMTAGLGLYATMNALIATAVSAPWLLAWRSMAGFGGGRDDRVRADLHRPGHRARAGGRSRTASCRRRSRPAPWRARRSAAWQPRSAACGRRSCSSRSRAGSRWSGPCSCRHRPPLSASAERDEDDDDRAAPPRRARHAARRQPRAAGELRRVHHDLRAAGDDPPRLVDHRGRHRLLLLRGRQHRPRPRARAPGRPHRPTTDRDPRAAPAGPLRAEPGGRPAPAGGLCRCLRSAAVG